MLQGFSGGSYGKESACNAGETWVQSLGWEDPLEKGLSAHFSILAWKISWTEEPGGRSSWGRRELDTTEWLSLMLQKDKRKHGPKSNKTGSNRSKFIRFITAEDWILSSVRKKWLLRLLTLIIWVWRFYSYEICDISNCLSSLSLL